jgi:hypothetical protein
MTPEYMETLRWTLDRVAQGLAKELGSRPVSVDWVDYWDVDGPWSNPWYYLRDEIGMNRSVVDSWFEDLAAEEAWMRVVGLCLQDLATHIFRSDTQAWADAMGEAADEGCARGGGDEVWDVVLRSGDRLEGQRVGNLLAECVPELALPLTAWALANADRISESEGESAAWFFLMGRRYLPELTRNSATASYTTTHGEPAAALLVRLIAAYQGADPEDLEYLAVIAVEVAAIEHVEAFGDRP